MFCQCQKRHTVFKMVGNIIQHTVVTKSVNDPLGAFSRRSKDHSVVIKVSSYSVPIDDPSGVCTTIEKRTLIRKPCIFPFKYKGRTYNGCITINDPDKVSSFKSVYSKFFECYSNILLNLLEISLSEEIYFQSREVQHEQEVFIKKQ